MAFTVGTITTVIPVTAGTGTVADLYSAVYAKTSDETNMSQVGSVYTVKLNLEVTLSADVVLTIATGETLTWDLTANKTSSVFCLDINTGSEVVMEPGSILQGDTNTSHGATMGIWGSFTVNGTSGSHATIEHFDYIYVNCMFNASYQNILGINYADIKDCLDTGSYALYFQYYLNEENHYVTNTTFSGTMGYAIGCVTDASGVNFDNITIDGSITGTMNRGILHQGVVNIKNSTFKNIYTYPTASTVFSVVSKNYEYSDSPERQRSQNDTYRKSSMIPRATYYNCTFDNNYTSSSGRAFGYCYTMNVALIDCKFQNCITGIYLTAYGAAIYVDNPTFVSISGADYDCSTGGAIYLCYKMDLSIKDSNGNFIEGATVLVEQRDGQKEREWYLTTDGSDTVNGRGNVVDRFGYVAHVIYQERHYDESTTDRSDSIASGRYHLITISKEGYRTKSMKIAFDGHKDMDIYLESDTSRLIAQS